MSFKMFIRNPLNYFLVMMENERFVVEERMEELRREKEARECQE